MVSPEVGAAMADVPNPMVMILLTIVPLGILLGLVLLFLRYKVLPKKLHKPFDWVMRIIEFFHW